MRMSLAVGVPIYKAFESCLRPVKDRPGFFTTYYCPANVLTMGWGHTNLSGVLPFKAGDVWSQDQCDDACVADIGVSERRVSQTFAGIPLNQNEFDALVDFDANTGGITRSSIPAKIKAGRRAEVAGTLALWNKAKGQVLPGLTRRRKAEGLLFDGKVDEALKVAGAHRDMRVAMPQRVDRPTPPVSEVAKRAAPEIAVATGGTGGAVATSQTETAKPAPTSTQTQQPAKPAPSIDAASNEAANAVIFWGLVALAAIGVMLIVRKWFLVDRDYA